MEVALITILFSIIKLLEAARLFVMIASVIVVIEASFAAEEIIIFIAKFIIIISPSIVRWLPIAIGFATIARTVNSTITAIIATVISLKLKS